MAVSDGVDATFVDCGPNFYPAWVGLPLGEAIGTARDLIEVGQVLLGRLRLLCEVATVGARGLGGRFQAPARVAAAGYEQPLVGAWPAVASCPKPKLVELQQ